MNLDANVLAARETEARRALAWHHHLQDLMLGCGLELLERVLTEWRNPEEMEDVMVSGSSKDVSNSGVSRESVRMKSKPCSKPATAWFRKE